MRGVLVIVLALAGCGSDGADSMNSDMSRFYGQVSGTCTLKGSTVTGTCFESPRCECVFPEAMWVCCYAVRCSRFRGFDGANLSCLNL